MYYFCRHYCSTCFLSLYIIAISQVNRKRIHLRHALNLGHSWHLQWLRWRRPSGLLTPSFWRYFYASSCVINPSQDTERYLVVYARHSDFYVWLYFFSYLLVSHSYPSKAHTPPLPHLPAFRGHSISDKISVLGVCVPNDRHSHHFWIFAKIFTIRNTAFNIISWKNRGIHTYFLNFIG